MSRDFPDIDKIVRKRKIALTALLAPKELCPISLRLQILIPQFRICSSLLLWSPLGQYYRENEEKLKIPKKQRWA